MTVEGSIEVEVIARVDEGAFAKTLDGPLNRQASRAGDQFGKTFSNTMQGAVGKDVLGAATREVEDGLRQIKALQQQGRVSTDEYTAAMERQRIAYLRLQTLQRGGAAAPAAAAATAATTAGETAAALEAAASTGSVSTAATRAGASLGKAVGVGLAVSAGIGLTELFTRGLPAAVSAAGELQASVERTRVVFGDASDGVQAFAKDADRNLLLTRQQVLITADAFGNLFRGAGLDPSKSAGLSTALTGIAQNLAAVQRVPVAQTLAALQAGVAGNIGPLRDLGINLATNRVQAEAFAEGLARPVRQASAIVAAQHNVAAATANLSKVQREHGTGTVAAAQAQDRLGKAQDALTRAQQGTTAPLSANAALLARVGLILRDTQGTTGAAAKSTDDYAVATEHLRAQFGNVSAELGNKLLPYVIDGEHKLSALIDQFHAGVGAGGELRTMLETAGKSAHQLGEVFRFLRDRAQEGVYGFAVAARGVLDVLGVLASVSDKLFHTHLHKDIDAAITKMRDLQGEIERSRAGATIPITVVVTTKTANANPALHAKGFIGPTIAEGLSASGVAGPYTPLQTGAKAVADQLHATQVKMRDDAIAAGKATQYAADQYAAYQERQRAAVQAAEDAARARGEATTRALQSQSDQIKKQVDILTAYGAKISDFRQGIFAGTTQFTALTGLVSDPTRATASAIVGSLQSRVLAEKLFAKNLATLGQRGLDKGVLAELAQAGPENRAFVSALAQASPEQIRALNAAERSSRAQAQALASQATDEQFGKGAVAKNQKALAEQNRRLAHIEQLLAAQPALIGKAVDQAGKNVKVAQKTGARTAVTR